jgi:NAD(P)-dependent dehydrogenase (short-subunit alcohol dehydrogenase family)
VSNRFDGRQALVTGGGSGIGEACSHTFAQGGMQVVVADLDVENGNRVVADIKQAGGDALFIKVDTSNPESVQTMIADAVTKYGKLNIAVHAASKSAREAVEAKGGTITILERTDRWVTARPRNRKLPIDRELKAARLGKVGGLQKRSDVTGAE